MANVSKDWSNDIHEMHEHYGFHGMVEGASDSDLNELLDFRTKFLQEELNELKLAETADDVVDALVDLIVVAIGTLDLYGVNPNIAWDRVLEANMNKSVGVKSTRPNPLGFPDLVKSDEWVAPSHDDNVGTLGRVFNEEYWEDR